jgi:hypothetical protein
MSSMSTRRASACRGSGGANDSCLAAGDSSKRISGLRNLGSSRLLSRSISISSTECCLGGRAMSWWAPEQRR